MSVTWITPRLPVVVDSSMIPSGLVLQTHQSFFRTEYERIEKESFDRSGREWTSGRLFPVDRFDGEPLAAFTAPLQAPIRENIADVYGGAQASPNDSDATVRQVSENFRTLLKHGTILVCFFHLDMKITPAPDAIVSDGDSDDDEDATGTAAFFKGISYHLHNYMVPIWVDNTSGGHDITATATHDPSVSMTGLTGDIVVTITTRLARQMGKGKGDVWFVYHNPDIDVANAYTPETEKLLKKDDIVNLFRVTWDSLDSSGNEQTAANDKLMLVVGGVVSPTYHSLAGTGATVRTWTKDGKYFASFSVAWKKFLTMMHLAMNRAVESTLYDQFIAPIAATMSERLPVRIYNEFLVLEGVDGLMRLYNERMDRADIDFEKTFGYPKSEVMSTKIITGEAIPLDWQMTITVASPPPPPVKQTIAVVYEGDDSGKRAHGSNDEKVHELTERVNELVQDLAKTRARLLDSEEKRMRLLEETVAANRGNETIHETDNDGDETIILDSGDDIDGAEETVIEHHTVQELRTDKAALQQRVRELELLLTTNKEDLDVAREKNARLLARNGTLSGTKADEAAKCEEEKRQLRVELDAAQEEIRRLSTNILAAGITEAGNDALQKVRRMSDMSYAIA